MAARSAKPWVARTVEHSADQKVLSKVEMLAAPRAYWKAGMSDQRWVATKDVATVDSTGRSTVVLSV